MFNFIKKYINKNEIINDSTLLFYDKKDILNLNFKNDNFNNNNLHYFEVINEYLNKTIKKEEKLSYENFINVLFFSFDNEILCEFLPIDFQNNSTDKLKLILNFIETKKYGIPIVLQFDQDLGGDDTSMVFINWLINYMLDNDLTFHKNFRFDIHSQNPVGVLNIKSKMDSFIKSIS